MKHILALIQRGVQTEVRAVILPLEERLDAQEKVNQELTKQFESVLKEMDLLKNVKNQQEFPALSVTLPGHSEQLEPVVWRSQRIVSHQAGSRREGGRRTEEDCTVRKKELCASARRVVGFTPNRAQNARTADAKLWSKGH